MITGLVGAGGGPKGAWSAGALTAAWKRGLLGGVARGYGNSVNAINIPFLCQEMFSPRSFDVLKSMWLSTEDKDVFKPWLIPYFPALWKGGLNSIEPLGEFLKDYIHYDRALQSKIPSWVSAVNLHTGKVEFGSSRSKHFLKWVLASSAHPIWFEPVEIDGQWYTDGGVVDVTPVKRAIKDGCSNLIVVLHSPEKKLELWGDMNKDGSFKRPGILSRTYRELGLAMEARLEDDLGVVQWINKGVLSGAEGFEGKRYVTVKILRPSKPLEVEMPHFRPKDSERLFDQGYADVMAMTF